MKAKIALGVTRKDKTDRYFSFRLKQDMNNEPAEFKQPPKVFVISNIDGNFQALSKLLLKARVINKYLEWTFDEGHLVVIGDCLDRNEEVIDFLWLIYSLEEKARRKGGYVHFILGSKEIRNLNGDWRYDHPKYAVKRASSRSPATALYHGNNELWQWLCTKNVTEKIGFLLFVSGGFSSVLNKLPDSLSQINEQSRSYYIKKQKSSDQEAQFWLESADSPILYKGYFDGTATHEQIESTFKKFNVKVIITGCSLAGSVTSFFNGKVINVNTNQTVENTQGVLIKRKHFYKISLGKEPEKINKL